MSEGDTTKTTGDRQDLPRLLRTALPLVDEGTKAAAGDRHASATSVTVTSVIFMAP